jgi:hypothetical protein
MVAKTPGEALAKPKKAQEALTAKSAHRIKRALCDAQNLLRCVPIYTSQEGLLGALKNHRAVIAVPRSCLIRTHGCARKRALPLQHEPLDGITLNPRVIPSDEGRLWTLDRQNFEVH